MTHKEDQTRTPLLDAIRAYAEASPAYFCIPGHHRGHGADAGLLDLLGGQALAADLTETDGMDDLHAPTGAILEAEDLAAKAWGADRSFFLVNGSASGNIAMFLAALDPGDTVIVDRQAHTSVVSALILTGAVPTWIPTSYLDTWNLPAPVTAEKVRAALNAHPDARAVFLTSPSYYGVAADIEAIAKICHERQKLLLIDEAHGAHFSFSRSYPNDALASGADMVVQSVHKTGGSLTQSSILHVQGDMVPLERVAQSVRIMSSTSPSYLLMASLDAARRQLAVDGERLLEEAAQKAEYCRDALSTVPGVRVLKANDLPEGASIDPLRITFSVQGLMGTVCKTRLFANSAVSVEMADAEHLVAVLSWGDTKEEIERLVSAVRREAEQAILSDAQHGQNAPIPLPEIVKTPREMFYAPYETIAPEDASGRVIAEQITPYPPGVPLLIPGERIAQEMVQELIRLRRDAVVLHGCTDPSLHTIRVWKE